MSHKEETSDLIGQRKLRIEKLKKLKAMGFDPYPAKSNKSINNSEIASKFETLENSNVVVAGRIVNFRSHGKLIFIDIQDQSGKLQVYIKSDELESTNTDKQILGFDDLDLLDNSDFIEIQGIVTKTQRGEISVLAKNVRLLAKSLRNIPSTLEDKEERFRKRYVDMNVNREVRERMERRGHYWEAHREFFKQNGFVEVNIPVLEHVPGGGDATPFVTHMNSIDEDFYLRISHELPLKRLIGAGFEKVYDIGPRFRNEGMSDEHLPEHVAMEYYWAYADWKDGMEFTKEMFNFVIDKVYGNKKKFNIRGFKIDFSNDWEIIDFGEIIKKHFSIDVYNPNLNDVRNQLKKIGREEDGVNVNRGIDTLWKSLRKTIGGPSFLINHPKFLSPLQKASESNPNMVERFQPIIAGSELGNGWSEVNDPIDQFERFVEQQEMRDSGDAEAQWLDIDYVEMLEYGMPPTFGYGHAERNFWFMEDVTAREGVPFPQMKFNIDEITKKIYPIIDFDDITKNRRVNEEQEVKETNTKPTSQSQDFENRIAIVVDSELPNWKVLNTVAHISAYIGHKLDDKFDTGEYFSTNDEKLHPRNTQYPIVVFSAKSTQLKNLMEKVRESKVLYHGFINEMIETTNDSEITSILKDKNDSDIEYLGIGFFGHSDKLKKLTNKFSLWK